MSLQNQLASVRIGLTRVGAVTSATWTEIELVPYPDDPAHEPFVPASYAIKADVAIYIRVAASDPADTTYEMELPAKTYFRVDVEEPADRFLYVKASVVGATGNVKATKITEVGETQCTAKFSGTPTGGNIPFTVTFTDSSTYDPVTWLWDFGDGSTSTLQNPTHSYTVAGSYTVTLTVTNVHSKDTEIKVAYITAVAFAADFTGAPLTGTAPLTVNFTDGTTDTPTAWAWDFGDAGTDTVQNPSHAYAAAGTYDVELVATNAYGNSTKTRGGYVVVSAAASEFGVYMVGAGPFRYNKLNFATEACSDVAAVAITSPVSTMFGNGTAAYTADWNTVNLERYTYATDAVAAAGTLTGASKYGCAVGNATAALYHKQSANPNALYKFTFGTETSAAASGSLAAPNSDYKCGVGIAAKGYFMGGQGDSAPYSTTYSTRVEKYTYATDAVAAGGDLATGTRAFSGDGTTAVAIVVGGEIPPAVAYTDYTEKYTYATETAAAATVLSNVTSFTSTIGNGTYSLTNRYPFGSAPTRVMKYTYATDVCVQSGTAILTDSVATGSGPQALGVSNIHGGLQ